MYENISRTTFYVADNSEGIQRINESGADAFAPPISKKHIVASTGNGRNLPQIVTIYTATTTTVNYLLHHWETHA
jgi:hypothetical protein